MVLAAETSLPAAGRVWAQLREEAGFSVAQLARATGLDPKTIRALETGGRVVESTKRVVAAVLALEASRRGA